MLVCSQCKALLTSGGGPCPDDGARGQQVDQLPIGAKVGTYRVVRLLGEGGMGFVYEAVHTTLGRRSAIKFLRAEFANDPGVVARFLQEARAVNLIRSDNIVSIYDFSDGTAGAVYFVMEFLEGEALADLEDRTGPLPMPLLLHLYDQLLPALAAAHQANIVHRDLKPANVFLQRLESEPYKVKLLDFGIAKLRGEGNKALTQAGDVLGTPQYMSPEQVQGEVELDARSDIWSIGVMLYQSATAQTPFVGDNFGAVSAQILLDTPRRPSEAAPSLGLPPAFDALVMKCLEREPAARFQTVAELHRALRELRRELGIEADDHLIGELATNAVGRDTSPMGRSLPMFQGAEHAAPTTIDVAPAGAARAEPKRSRRGLWIGAGLVAAAGVATALVLARGDKPSAAAAAATPGSAASASASGSAPPPGPVVVAPADQLRAAITSTDPAAQSDAVTALELVGGDASVPLLYEALAGNPDVRVRAARALQRLAPAGAATKLRAALDNSGAKVKVELAACLLRLGDKQGAPILVRGLDDPSLRLIAARALAASGDPAMVKLARPALQTALADAPEGRDAWRQAAMALAELGDKPAQALVAAELALPDGERATAMALALVGNGDAGARARLAALVGDATSPRRAAAALELARVHDAAGLVWVAEGLRSLDSDERRHAVAVAAQLAEQGGRAHQPAIDAMAANDSDRGVQLTAAAAVLAMSQGSRP